MSLPFRCACIIDSVVGPSTTSTSGDAAGSMNTWADYQQQLGQQQQQQNLGNAVAGAGAGFSSAAKPAPNVSLNAPPMPMAPITSPPQPQQGGLIQSPQQGIPIAQVLQRILGM